MKYLEKRIEIFKILLNDLTAGSENSNLKLSICDTCKVEPSIPQLK